MGTFVATGLMSFLKFFRSFVFNNICTRTHVSLSGIDLKELILLHCTIQEYFNGLVKTMFTIADFAVKIIFETLRNYVYFFAAR